MPALPSISETQWRSQRTLGRIVLTVVACGILAFGLIWSGRRTSPPVEVLRSELCSRDGRLYRVGQETVPFTGAMIERYESGSLKSRSIMSDGLLHGVSEGWQANGQLQVREHFKQGKSHGLRTRWHENGAKMSEVMVVEGQLQGTFRRWFDDGKLAEQMDLKEGKPDGWARSFYPSGFLKAQARLKDGELAEQKFWNDGERNNVSVAGITN